MTGFMFFYCFIDWDLFNCDVAYAIAALKKRAESGDPAPH
jgi:hypothetical protein